MAHESSSYSPTPEEQHEEALVLNDELEKRKLVSESAGRSNTEFVELALLERSELIGNAFTHNPVLSEMVQRSFRREALKSGVPVFIDPNLFEENLKKELKDIQPFLEYLQSEKLEEDCIAFNGFLPPQYRKTDQDHLPPIFIYCDGSAFLPDEASDIGNIAGFHDDRSSADNIHIVVRDVVEGVSAGFYRFIFLHELAHNCQPQKRSTAWDVFIEGVPQLIATKVITPNQDIHSIFIDLYKKEAKRRSGHPLYFSVLPDGKFSIPLENQLFPRREYQPYMKNPDYREAERIRYYYFTASLFEWYRAYKDPQVHFFDLEHPNYQYIEERLSAFDSDVLRMLGHEELSFITSAFCQMALPENDHRVGECVEKLKGIPEEAEDDEMVIHILTDFVRQARETAVQLQNEYNVFLDTVPL